MKKEDVIRIAKEVWGDDSGKPWHESALVHLEAFAMRVEAEEREACAKICDETNNWPIAHAIRARGQE